MSKSILPLLRGAALAYSFYRSAPSLVPPPLPVMNRVARYAPKARRMYRRKAYRSRPSYGVKSSFNVPRDYVRYSAPESFTMVSGFAGGFKDISLNLVPTADIIPAWQFFRIQKVTAIVTTRNDPAAATSNHHTHAYLGNDVNADDVAPTAPNGVTDLANCKYQALVAGASMFYTFYPKVKGVVTTVVSSASGISGIGNQTLGLDSGGIVIPHCRLLLAFQSTAVTTHSIDVVYRIHFRCWGQS